jgi:hypothetical protein
MNKPNLFHETPLFEGNWHSVFKYTLELACHIRKPLSSKQEQDVYNEYPVPIPRAISAPCHRLQQTEASEVTM